MPRCDRGDLRQPLRRMHHHRDGVCLRLVPEPVRGAVGEPGPVLVAMESQAHAQHSRLVAPSRKQAAAAAAFKGDASHDGKTARVFAGRFEGVVVAVALE